MLKLPGGFGQMVDQAAKKYGVDPALIAAVMETESKFNPDAVSGAGARGLMQLMPATARGLGVTNASDPLQNVLGGAALRAAANEAMLAQLQVSNPSAARIGALPDAAAGPMPGPGLPGVGTPETETAGMGMPIFGAPPAPAGVDAHLWESLTRGAQFPAIPAGAVAPLTPDAIAAMAGRVEQLEPAVQALTPAMFREQGQAFLRSIKEFDQTSVGEYESASQARAWGYSTCSAASLTAVLRAAGQDVKIADVMKAMPGGMTIKLGLVSRPSLVNAANQFGATATQGGLNPMQVGLGVQVGSVDSIMTQGNLQATGKPTDVAIQGDGFFQLTDGTNTFYTRDGNFTTDSTGRLIHAATGMGVVPAVTVPAGATNLTIAQSGQVSWTVGSSVTAGPIIQLANFTNPAGLTRTGNNLFLASDNSGTATPNNPGTNGLGTIQAGFLEMSNVDLAAQFTNMIIAQRGFQANSRVITASDEILQDLVNIKR